MDELAKALAEAIRAGTDLAPNVVVGYYVVRALDAVSGPLALITVASVAGHTIRKCVLRYAEIDEKRVIVERQQFK